LPKWQDLCNRASRELFLRLLVCPMKIVDKITTEENRVIHPLMSKRHNDVIKENNVKNLKLDFRGFLIVF